MQICTRKHIFAVWMGLKSKKTSKTRQKFDFRMKPKIRTLLPTCFKITAMHSVCCCSLPVWKRSSLKKGTPRDLFWPCPGSAPGRIWPKNNNTCKGPWVLHPYQVSSKSIKRFWRRSWKCKCLTDGRTDDGRTDDGRRTTRDHNRSLEPLAPVP